MYKNYIFDLYGTLVDIHTNEKKSSLWRHMATYMSLSGALYTPGELKRAYHAEVARVHEATCRRLSAQAPAPSPEETEIELGEVITSLYAARGLTATREEVVCWARMFRAVSLERLALYEGAAAVLDGLRRAGRGVYLLSNAQRLFTEPELRSLGLYDRFDGVLLSSDVGAMKPSPVFYNALLERYSIDPATAVMVGNDPSADAWGGHRRGLATMYVHTAQSPALVGELPPGCRRLGTIADVLEA